MTAVPWDGFGRILQAPRGRLLNAQLHAGSDRRAIAQPVAAAHVTAHPVPAADAAASPVAAAAPHRSAPPPAPPKRRHQDERLAVLPREDYRQWAVSLLASFRGAGR